MQHALHLLDTDVRVCDSRRSAKSTTFFFVVAPRTGFEPVTSSVTGWCSNQLNYRSVFDGDSCAYQPPVRSNPCPYQIQIDVFGIGLSLHTPIPECAQQKLNLDERKGYMQCGNIFGIPSTSLLRSVPSRGTCLSTDLCSHIQARCRQIFRPTHSR